MSNNYEKLSEERKQLQKQGLLPERFSTAGWQLFKQKYLWAANYREQITAIADTLAKHSYDYEKYRVRFFNIVWDGWFSPSTPILANCGTDRGMVVSCSGSTIEDSIEGFYDARKEAALLTKYGFGTSAYFGNIRPRGSAIRSGGQASGVLPELKAFVQMSRDVSQGGVRRGQFAAYLPIDHGDAEECLRFLEKEPDDVNIGWNISDDFTDRLNRKEPRALDKFASVLKTKMLTGKGYFCFPDKVNRALPKYYKNAGKTFKASNLCTEICLPADEDLTFTCVLGSLNLALYDEWKDTDLIETAVVFLDCVCSEFISKGKTVRGLEKAVRFTEKARAIGLGVMGFHTYLQNRMIPFESFDAHQFNNIFFNEMWNRASAHTKYLGEKLGYAEWGMGEVRNCSLIAIAPTKSSALLMGGVSEGINPDPAMVFTQSSAGGEMARINPPLLKVMKEKGVYTEKNIQEVVLNFGSVQDVEWLTPSEKRVFKTAFEINPDWLINLASIRSRYIDQWQSLNLFFSVDASAKDIAAVHKKAFLDPNIKGLYYIYSHPKIGASKQNECEACGV